ncbi:hypothetical protein OG599_27910 [Streptomyces sp. NBC_01335]|uniref:accessory Sec system protein Asp2 n=1 Tax=Streptomyces sp. NBC_01335 TaxID=2903828 RepID=UPI002E12C650|nr:hypothetical protein OG599_27910 [Streptomyces sp. NBC_01335]
MSDAVPAGRQIFDGVDTSGRFPVDYRFAHAKNGNRRLMVVFAHPFAPDEYGWADGVLDGTRSNILWIRDNFDGENSYYLCKEMDFGLEESVIGLISNVMHALELTPDDCIMFGSSTGGTAALYYGLKYGFRSIVAGDPQFAVGSFAKQHTQSTARFMTGEDVPDRNVEILDALLPETVWLSGNRDADIYVISSPGGARYEQHVEPYIGHFRDYGNVNFIHHDSPLDVGHDKAASRNLPVMLGLAHLLVDGVTPRIGSIRTGYEQPERGTAGIDAYLRSTSLLQESFPAPVVDAPVSGATAPGSTVPFTGSAPGAVRVSLWENGKFLFSPQVAPDGRWSWDPGRDWTAGKHVVRLFAVDAVGHHSPRTEAVFHVPAVNAAASGAAAPTQGAGGQGAYRVPTTRPTAPMVWEPADGLRLPGPAVVLTGYAPGSARVEFVEGGLRLGVVQVAPDGTWAWDSGWSWMPGAHDVECFAVDPMGNESVRASVRFAVAGPEDSHGGIRPPASGYAGHY